MGRRNGAVVRDAPSGWTQVELRHHPLSAFVIDAQVQRDLAMPVGRMLAVNRFDCLFQCLIFGRLLQAAVDIFTPDP